MNPPGIFACLLVFWLGGCAVPERGGYRDSAPSATVRAADVRDAEPRPEPILAAGNTSPYQIAGRYYYVLPTARGYRETGIASWYGTKFHGRPTANGERYDLYAPTAAHRTLPIPSYVRVTNLDNGRSMVVRVNDRGPFHDNRIIDLSYAAAVRLGFAEEGTAAVRVEALPVLGSEDQRGVAHAGYRYLQLGAFEDPGVARRLRLELVDFVDAPVTVSPVHVHGRTLRRVRIGPVGRPQELQRLQEELAQRGYGTALPLP